MINEETKVFAARVVKDEISLANSRERADVWRVVCSCGWCGQPHMTPKLADRDMIAHSASHQAEA